jgi:hypothetical protein
MNNASSRPKLFTKVRFIWHLLARFPELLFPGEKEKPNGVAARRPNSAGK